MVYQGSKARLRKHIVPILQKCIDDNNIKTYIEPFVGGANVIDHIVCEKRYGGDANSDLIDLLCYMRDNPKLNIFPEECSFELYKEVRESRKSRNSKYPAEYIAGIGYFASYGGRYFDGGYGRDDKGGASIYPKRLRNAREQAPLLKGIAFQAVPYWYWSAFENCVFYLDPPYKGTKVYDGKEGFDYEHFYDFVRKLSQKNYVFISEYNMPDDFKVIWQKDRKVLQKSDRKEGEVATEKLFVLDK